MPPVKATSLEQCEGFASLTLMGVQCAVIDLPDRQKVSEELPLYKVQALGPLQARL